MCATAGSASLPPPSDPPSVAELGEFGLIARITAGRASAPGTLLGPGDDAAVLAAADGRVVVTTDVLVEGVHFRLDWSTPHQVGRKAVAANLADVVAMGAVPTALDLSDVTIVANDTGGDGKNGQGAGEGSHPASRRGRPLSCERYPIRRFGRRRPGSMRVRIALKTTWN